MAAMGALPCVAVMCGPDIDACSHSPVLSSQPSEPLPEHAGKARTTVPAILVTLAAKSATAKV